MEPMDLMDISVRSYNLPLICLSVAIAILASYTSLNLSGYAYHASMGFRKIWLGASATAMGLGIWTMHFTGILAMRQPFPISYHLFTTFFSLLLAIAASFIAVFLISYNTVNAYRFMGAGFVMGSGIAAMHYVGMSAIQSPYLIQYQVWPFVCSILIAIAVSYAALYVTFRLQNQASGSISASWKLYGAGLLGIAVAGMHYTGMYATHFMSGGTAAGHGGHPNKHLPELFQMTIEPAMLYWWLGVTFSLLLSSLLVGAYVDRKLAIDAAQLTSTQFTTLFNNNPDMISTFSSKGQLININPSVFEMLGYTPSELIYYPLLAKRLFQALYTEEDWENLLQRSEPSQHEIRMPHKDGSPVDLFVTSIPMKVRKRILGVTAIAKNITDRKRDEELLRRSDKLNIAGHLAAGVAHEIRNPLTAIKGFIQLSHGGPLSDGYRDIILSEIEQIERIITEFLLLAKPQTGNFERAELQPLTDHVVTLVQAQANMSNVEIAAAYEDDLPDIYADENKLKQVFVNLLKNAIESMEKGGTIRVKVGRSKNQEVTVRIEDEGTGISEELRKKLGEPFYSTKEKGTGLGLMVSFKIISEHQGHIEFGQASSGGTVVKVTLPALTEDNPSK